MAKSKGKNKGKKVWIAALSDVTFNGIRIARGLLLDLSFDMNTGRSCEACGLKTEHRPDCELDAAVTALSQVLAYSSLIEEA